MITPPGSFGTRKMTASPQASGPVPSPSATDISLRIWGSAGREAKPLELSWNTQSALVYMITDLVGGSDGVLLADSRGTMVAQFETPAKALKAAKQIQGSILEFARHRPDCRYTAAIVIHGETERGLIEGRDSAGANALGGSLLQCAKPTQILMTEGAYEKLREMPGLRFRPVTPSGAPGSDSVMRGRELIWRTPEPAPYSSEVLPQATQIFVQNSGPPPVKVLPMPESILAHQDGMEAAVPDSTGEAHVDVHPSIFGTATDVSDPRSGDPGQEGLADDSRTLGRQLIDVSSPVVRRYLALAGSVIVLSVVVGMIVHYWKPVVVDHPTGAHQRPSEPTTVPAEKLPPVNSLAPETPAPPVEASPVPKSKPPKVQVEKPVKVGPSDFSQKDIPFLLRKAEQDAGAGRYDDARREYKIVLQLDPNNASAKQGLHRLELSR